tara:strand:- start:63 stop:665 length:603 start_codon:yes stop_codon:yes gene_type:complete
LLAQVVAVLGGGLLAGSIGFLLALYAGTHLRRLVAGIGVLAGIIWGLKHYLLVLLFIYGVPTGVVEPILQQPTSFYLFTLPLLDSVFWLLFFVALVGLLAALLVWESGGSIRFRHVVEMQGHRLVLPMANAGFAWVLGAGMVLAVFHLLYSAWGVVQGPGWVDVHVLYPALLIVTSGYVLVGLLPLFGGFRRSMSRKMDR